VRKLACAFSEPEQLHAQRGGSKLPHSKEHSGPLVLVAAGLLCSSVVSFCAVYCRANCHM